MDVIKMWRSTRASVRLLSLQKHMLVGSQLKLERQNEPEESRQSVQQKIQDREEDLELLQQELETIDVSADRAVEDSEKVFTELICLIQKRSCEVKQQIRSRQETESSRVKDVQEKLRQEIRELRRKDAELKLLSITEDHNQFLHSYSSLSQLSEATDSSSIRIRPLRHFEDMTAAVSGLRDQLQAMLRDKWTNISLTGTEAEPKTRAEFLRYSCELTLDPNTANTRLLLSKGNRKAKVTTQQQPYCSHPERFTYWYQVLSRESLTGRCYWEVKCRGGVDVAVAYKNISREGRSDESGFGLNDKSWALSYSDNTYIFLFNDISTPVSGPRSSRVGVYLDHTAGVLAFYSISETMTLLHRVQTTFTQPLYAGLYLHLGHTAEFCKLKYFSLRGF